jgi:hypothetical protein
MTDRYAPLRGSTGTHHILIRFVDGTRRRAASYPEALEIVAEKYPDADCVHEGDLLQGGTHTCCYDHASGADVALFTAQENPAGHDLHRYVCGASSAFNFHDETHPSFRRLPGPK